MKRKCFAVLAPLFFCVANYAQNPQMPQPAPELKKLDYFVGTWKTDAEMKASPNGPGGKMTATDHNEWMQGNFFLMIHSNFSLGMGSGLEVGVMGYDPVRKVYTYASYNSFGEHETGTGTLDGDTWTWNSEQTGMPGGKWRYTQKILSPTSFSIKFEMAPDGSTWATAMEGKSTKQ
ncbi:MAG: DUF1579 family protein [Acidobacteriaceae bacterium]|nr:DUF1579 family protein [Acidobacteriaceae bacterium]